MIRSAAIVVCLLVFCDMIADTLRLPVPGAGLGLLLLCICFAFRGGPDHGFDALFDFAVPYFPLFFVPAAVGVIASLDVLSGAWLEIGVAVVAGTSATLIATGWIAQSLIKKTGKGTVR